MQEANHERPNKTKSDRARFLNVIYFIDSNRTHYFQLKLRWSFAFGATIGLLLLWSFASTFLLIQESQESSAKSQRNRILLATIFDYQTRYDHVYERSYPEAGDLHLTNLDIADELAAATEEPADATLANTTKSPPLPTAYPSSNITMAAKAPPASEVAAPVLGKSSYPPHEEIPQIPTPLLAFQLGYLTEDESENDEDEPETRAVPQPVGVAKTMAEEQKSPDVKPPSKTIPKEQMPPIEIGDVKSIHHAEELEFKFALRNIDSPNLTSGYVIGIATFADNNGNINEIASSADGAKAQRTSLSRISRKDRFSIRYYKNKTLKFAKPAETSGSFEEVHITIGDAEGYRKEFVYNLEKDSIDSVRGTGGPGIKNQEGGN